MLIVLAIFDTYYSDVLASCVKIVPQTTALVIEAALVLTMVPGKWESTLKCRSLTVWQEK